MEVYNKIVWFKVLKKSWLCLDYMKSKLRRVIVCFLEKNLYFITTYS